MIWIGYTTHYREGSAKFARAAETLRDELARSHPTEEILVEPLGRKAEFVAAMGRVRARGARVDQLHFLGHSGMYGIMFGSTSWPEQFSPHEWRALTIPFAAGASAHFHACRTARWFAPFFARTFGVRTYGHHGYTTVSTRADRFRFEGYRPRAVCPIYLVSVPGRKTHGIAGALRKYLLRPTVSPMLAFDPEPLTDAGYDAVAPLYDRAFSDIRERRDEWRWLSRRVDDAGAGSRQALRMLDIGCGNGALLFALEDRIGASVGVDISRAMIARANARASDRDSPKLAFATIDGPVLPFGDGSFDIVTSFLSFRYLDWDPMLAEIRRVLTPTGRILIVDMVEKTLEWRDAKRLVRAAITHALRPLRNPRFVRDVGALTADPAWKVMLRHNPIRAEHEYRWYLESRFPGRRLETLTVGLRARLVAFDSGPLAPGPVAPLSYP